jgi:Ca2+-binding EF-hand superfamily protein
MELPEVRAIVDKAMADGKLSSQEIDNIMAAIMADGKVSIDEMELLEMIETKILNQEVDLH